jgi:hypothetical protein
MPVFGLRRCAPEIGFRFPIYRFRGEYLLIRIASVTRQEASV